VCGRIFLEQYFLPNTGYPEVPAGELESGKVIDPWNPNREARREMGQPSTQLCATELSGNGTLPWHATTPEAKYQWLPRDRPGTPIEVNASLHLTFSHLN
jgi:hypothetical protein